MSASTDRKLREAIQQLAGTHLRDRVSIVDCTVDSVDLQQGTCAATSIGENAAVQIPAVSLESLVADGLLIVPKVGSTITVIYSTRNDAYVFKYSDIDAVYYTGKDWQFGDGTYGGLVKIQILKTQTDATLAGIKAAVAAALAVIDTQLVALSQPGGSAAAFNSAAAAIPKLDLTTLENTDVKHGA